MDFCLSLCPKTLEASQLRDGFKYDFKINYLVPDFDQFVTSNSDSFLKVNSVSEVIKKGRSKMLTKVTL